MIDLIEYTQHTHCGAYIISTTTAHKKNNNQQTIVFVWAEDIEWWVIFIIIISFGVFCFFRCETGLEKVAIEEIRRKERERERGGEGQTKSENYDSNHYHLPYGTRWRHFFFFNSMLLYYNLWHKQYSMWRIICGKAVNCKIFCVCVCVCCLCPFILFHLHWWLATLL